MDHLYNTRPHFQSIIDKQRIAHHRLTKDQTSRTAPERANFERTLRPVPISDVELPKIPLVRIRNDDENRHWVILGEVSQMPGKVILVNINDGSLNVSYTTDQLELAPPLNAA